MKNAAMPKKKSPTYDEAVFLNFKDILKVVDFNDIIFVEHLEGDDHRNMLKFCHEVYNNPFFLQIINNFLYTQAMFTADDAITYEQYRGGKLMCQGIKTVEEFFRKYAYAYEQEFRSAPDDFDRRASFSKAII